MQSWRDFPNEIKEYIRSRVLDEFNLDSSCSEDLRTVNELMATLFRRHKGLCHDHLSSANIQNRSTLTIHHDVGPMSFHRLAEKMLLILMSIVSR
ncbi:hypothetical protein I3843_16G036300 [Carya illinoinensis]|nr:hypothetical protein I3843_16G036300 [Carya illinoinensis]